MKNSVCLGAKGQYLNESLFFTEIRKARIIKSSQKQIQTDNKKYKKMLKFTSNAYLKK